MAGSKVTVRMYHVGFGDAFLVTIRRGNSQWRMLIDCGVHGAGIDKPLDEVVGAIIDEVTDAHGNASIDLIVGTHRHADHIAGFADSRWDAVKVGAVWLPWAENLKDPEAVKLQEETKKVATQLAALAKAALAQDGNQLAVDKKRWKVVELLGANSDGDDDALRRLRGSTRGFVAPDDVEYVSNDDDEEPLRLSPFPDVRIHVVGPSRKEAVLKKMNPPKSAEWLTQLAAVAAGGPQPSGGRPLFDHRYALPPEMLEADDFTAMKSHATFVNRLHQLGDDEALLAASKLENWCNNTSVFIVLEVNGHRLVFPGDTQEGGWRHVMDRDHTLALVADADFYKVSHHGSHNGTPQRFMNDVLGDGHSLMMPFSPVTQFGKIPVKGLVTAFKDHQHRVACGDPEYRTDDKAVVGPNELWSEVSF